MKCSLFLTTLTLGLALLSGCAHPYAKHISGPGLDDVTVEDIRAQIEEGRLSAQVCLYNEDDDPVRLRYRVTWLNASGLAIGLGSPTDAWLSTSLAPQERRYLRITAPSNEAADFHIYVQELD